MASNQTANLGLSQWEADDEVLRADFNADNAKLDAAVAALTQTVNGKADTSALTALTQTVNAKADTAAMDTALAQKADMTAVNAALAKKGVCRFEMGSYVGSGEYGQSHPNILTFTGKPMVVFVGWQMRMIRGFGESLCHVTRSSLSVTWGERSVQWYSQYNTDSQCSASGTKYRYLALISTEE